MFGIGFMELLILLVLGVLLLAAPIATIVLIIALSRKGRRLEGDAAVIAELREENRRLREELAASKKDYS